MNLNIKWQKKTNMNLSIKWQRITWPLDPRLMLYSHCGSKLVEQSGCLIGVVAVREEVAQLG